jgi:hypothetical protein
MKLLLSALLLANVAQASDSAKIKKIHGEICNYAKSCEVNKVAKGKTALEVVREFALTVGEADADVEVVASGDTAPGADDVIYGTLSMKGAMNHVDDMVAWETVISEAQGKAIRAKLYNLRGTGVEFGYTPNRGGSVCGTVFPSLLLIDVPAKTVYEVALFGHPDCK